MSATCNPSPLTYAADAPGIPIRLTAVATEPDLGILAYVLGEHRAIPTNYLHVQINEAAIDWFFGGFNYAKRRHASRQRGRRPSLCHGVRWPQRDRRQLFMVLPLI